MEKMVDVVEIDDQGRIYMPARLRSKLRYTRFRVRLESGRLVLVPVKPAVEKHYGMAGPAKHTSPEEIDEAVAHVSGEKSRGELR